VSGEGVLFWADYSKPMSQVTPNMNDVYGNGMYLGYGGDWGEGNHDNYFCSNGLLDAQRLEEPEVREIKKCYQPLVFTALNQTTGNVSVRNEYYAKNGNDFDWVWTLYEDDEVIGTGPISVPSIPPMTNQVVLNNIPAVSFNVPYRGSLPAVAKPGAEYFLMIQACLKEAEDWAPKGYPLCEEQYKLTVATALPLIYSEDFGYLKVSQAGSNYDIIGNDFKVSFNSATGALLDYTAGGVQLISSGPQPTFFRAKYANDRSGTNINNWVNTDNTKTLGSFRVTPAADKKSVTVAVTYNLTINTSSFVDMTYVIFGNGTVRVTTALRTTSTDQLLRFGVDLIMPPGFENIDWYTRGPSENLSDRLTGSYIGRYQTTVTDNFWPYVKPQDTGTHQDTRYMALTSDSKDKGLMIVATGSRLFEANALHYTWRDMNSGTDWWSTGIKHPYQLSPRSETIVSVSYGSRGTGNESCMSVPPLSAYQLQAGNRSYSYTFVPFDKEDQAALTDVSRFYRDVASMKSYRTYGLTAEVKGNNIEAGFYNNTSQSKAVNLIAAVYDEDGKLVYIEFKEVTVNTMASSFVQFDLDISRFAGLTCKVFAWESETMVPLCPNTEDRL